MASTDRLTRLRAFLAEGAGAPFVWGERDCALWACDWIKAERGNDPAERLRGTYGSALACARLLNDAGGLVALSAGSPPAPGSSKPTTRRPATWACLNSASGRFSRSARTRAGR